jgi:hypothetical protein
MGTPAMNHGYNNPGAEKEIIIILDLSTPKIKKRI